MAFAEPDRDLARLLLDLRPHLKLGAWVGAIFVFGSVIYALLAPHVYTAQVRLLPQSGAESGELVAQIQMLTGSGLGVSETNELLYGKILRSSTVLNTALAETWDSNRHGSKVTLYRILNVEEPEELDDFASPQAFSARKKLRERVLDFSRDPVSGYMALSVSLVDDPTAAAELANFLADRIDDTNRRIRTKKARAHRDFVQSQLTNTSEELHKAEEAVTAFLKSNQRYSSSPDLLQRYGELERNSEALKQVWIELRTQLAVAEIDANREEVSLTILDPAVPPVERSKPRRRLIVLLGLVAALAAGVAVTLARYQWAVIASEEKLRDPGLS